MGTEEKKDKDLAYVEPSGKDLGPEITLDEFLEKLKGFRLKEWVYLVGGLVEHGKTRGDIDILIREKEQNPALEFRIYRQFPPEIQQRIHFIYDTENFGPFTSFIPLFVQSAEPHPKNEKIEMDSSPDDEEGDILFEIFELKEKTTKPFAHSMGQKYQLKNLHRFMPDDYEVYVEPFCGSATLFFSIVTDTRKKYVLNDKGIFSRILRDIRDLTDDDIEYITRRSWEPSEYIFNRLLKSKPRSRAERIYRFAYIQKYSWGGLGRNFSHKPAPKGASSYSRKERWTKAREKLKGTIITTSDYKKAIEKYDSPKTFFYIDPPYYSSKDSRTLAHKDVERGINVDEFVRTLKNIKGKFLATIGNEKEWLKKLNDAGFYLYKTKTIQALDLKKNLVVVFVSNYKLLPNQKKHREKLSADDFAPLSDSLEPGKFFTQLKGIVGYRKNETYTIEGLKELIRTIENFYPCFVDEKFDGMRVQIHKAAERVVIYAEDGGDVTKRFPSIVEEVRSLKAKNLILDAEITGWTEKEYRKGKHIGRSDVSGYAHRKDTTDDSYFFANVFDMVFYEKDIHNLPLTERIKMLNEVFESAKCERVKNIEHILAKDETELESAVIKVSNMKGSEGAMIKSASSTYPLNGQTNRWIKFKNEVDMDVMVVSVSTVKGSPNTFNYLTVIEDVNGNLIPAGKTYNTNIRAKVGDIIRVAFVNLNKYTDPKDGRIWYNMWSPRVIELREDKKRPDNNIVANRIVKDTKGEIEIKPYPNRYKEIIRTETENDFFLIYPEKKKMRFVLQAHIRGKSVHLDSRRQINDDFSVGMTHFVEKGLSKRPENFEEAKNLFYKEIFPLVKEQLSDPNLKFLSGRKALVPNEWLDIEGTIEKQEPGSTTNLPGFMIILDSGLYEAGALQPDFHEYFFYGKLLNGKFVDRLIENKKEWKKVGEDVISWLFFKSNAIPYVLSKRAMEINWIPPYMESSLPTEIEKKIPSELRYWLQKDKNTRIQIRNKLIEKIKNKEVQFQTKAKFTLSEMTVERDRIVVREGPKETLYHLFFQIEGRDEIQHFRLQESPIDSSLLMSILEPTKNKKLMTLEGTLRPKTSLNPFKTKATLEIIEKEKPAEIMEWTKTFIKVKFKGERLYGYYIFVRERPDSNFWRMEKSETPSPIDSPPKIEKVRAERFFSKVEIHSVDSLKKSEIEPKFIEINGILFHEGIHKGKLYTREELKKAILKPREGFSLCYVNWSHEKEEDKKVGVLLETWWDEDTKWYCPNNKKNGSGAIMYRAIITEPTAIKEITDKNVLNVSAELSFEPKPEKLEDGNLIESATDIEISGMAITTTPALPSADIECICSIDKSGKRRCKTL